MRKQTFEKNVDGRDFVLGDLHGCLEHFEALLEKIDFDKTKDRMFSVGDLVDRGPKSMECLRLIDEPWFHAVKGNHEEMMISVAEMDGEWAERIYYDNGGAWIIDLVDANNKDFYEHIKLAKELPELIIVETEHLGKVGICHAESPSSWSSDHLDYKDQRRMMWGRDKISWSPTMGKVPEGVSMTVHGHTPIGIKHHERMNAWWIDSGCFYTGMLTVLEISGKEATPHGVCIEVESGVWRF